MKAQSSKLKVQSCALACALALFATGCATRPFQWRYAPEPAKSPRAMQNPAARMRPPPAAPVVPPAPGAVLITRTANGVRFQFPPVPGANTVQLESSNDLATWKKQFPPTPASVGSLIQVNPATAPAQFYRVRVLK